MWGRCLQPGVPGFLGSLQRCYFVSFKKKKNTHVSVVVFVCPHTVGQWQLFESSDGCFGPDRDTMRGRGAFEMGKSVSNLANYPTIPPLLHWFHGRLWMKSLVCWCRFVEPADRGSNPWQKTTGRLDPLWVWTVHILNEKTPSGARNGCHSWLTAQAQGWQRLVLHLQVVWRTMVYYNLELSMVERSAVRWLYNYLPTHNGPHIATKSPTPLCLCAEVIYKFMNVHRHVRQNIQ